MLFASSFLFLQIFNTFCEIHAQNAIDYARNVNAGKVIVDVDGGGDDALALLLAIAKQRSGISNLNILAITCLRGNVELDVALINVLKTLQIADSKIPVYAGQRENLLENLESDYYFGNDGFGDFEFENPPSLSQVKPGNAVLKIIELVEKYPGEVTIIALGPLTNLAMAIKLRPSFRGKIQQIIIMGGSVWGVSNVRPFIEFNSERDPESNFIVFNSTVKPMNPVILFPWDVCVHGVNIEKSWRVNVLGKIPGKIISFMNDVERIALPKGNPNFWIPADLFTMLAVLFPKLVISADRYHVDGITQGELRGMLRVDFDGLTKLYPNTVIIRKLNKELTKRVLLKYMPG